MKEQLDLTDPKELARKIVTEIQELTVQNAHNVRSVQRKYSQSLKQAKPEFIMNVAREIFKDYDCRGIAYELIRSHSATLKRIGKKELEEFGQNLNSWGAVDTFAGLLAGPAWLHRQVPDELIHTWAHSKDRWWRRAALVCTVVLNRKSLGGTGDVPRTLKVCRLLAADKDDMVVKAMSWALRELIIHDSDAVRQFLSDYQNVLASRVKREVNNKLTTGLKNPKRRAG